MKERRGRWAEYNKFFLFVCLKRREEIYLRNSSSDISKALKNWQAHDSISIFFVIFFLLKS